MKMPSFFLSHGGGPWPWMEDFRQHFVHLEASLKSLPSSLPGKPDAVLVITAHWESSSIRVSSAAAPGMIYDYYGFPPHTYSISYPAPGSPDLAEKVALMLSEAGIDAATDEQRGYDHGTFVPLQVMYPDHNIPVVQVSIRSDYDPEYHFRIGQALAPLRDQNILILGSGLSFHNLSLMGPVGKKASAEFDDWLNQTLLGADPEIRKNTLMNWEQAPSARICQPREDHLVPLFVALGTADNNDRVSNTYREHNLFGGISASSFRFG